MKPTTIESFMDRVYPEPNTGCWLWSGKPDKDGYGHISLKKHGFRSPHRLSYYFHKGDFDRTLHVLHKCDNSACVNPDHLFLGTSIDNCHDRHNKGRTAKGTSHYKAKLTEKDVLSIRELNKNGGYDFKQLAALFHVTTASIGYIVRRQTWKHL